MDSAKFVNDEDMKLIWSKVLSGEFESPGTFSKSLIRVLSELPKFYAEVFSNLCRTQISVYNFDTNNRAVSHIQSVFLPRNIINGQEYNDMGLHFNMITELQNMGLIYYYGTNESAITWDSSIYPTVKVKYGEEEITVTKFQDKTFLMGAVTLTSLGESLANITKVVTIPGYINHIKEYFKNNGMEFY